MLDTVLGVLSSAYTWFLVVLGYTAYVSFYSYIVPFVLQAWFFNEQDLKVKYGAKWALVTGASSGIGRALTEKLAAQGLSVVMVALDDNLLAEFHGDMVEQYAGNPDVEFRKVGVNLGKEGYLQVIADATYDIDVQLVFNNAGYVITGLYADVPMPAQLCNFECNAAAPVKITHLFLNRMLNKGLRGCVCFTSSPAGLMPTPLTVLYSATKSFLTTFAASLAPEVHPAGIDVLVVHPSPVDTRFYQGNTHNLDAMRAFQKTAYPPTSIASCFFKSVGRAPVHDHGYFSIALKMLLKAVDYNFLAALFARTAAISGDYTKTKKDRPLATDNSGGVIDSVPPHMRTRASTVEAAPVSRSYSRSMSRSVQP